MTAKDSIDSARSITVLFFLATTVALAAYLNTVSSSIAGKSSSGRGLHEDSPGVDDKIARCV